jgi:hypothetical protein
MVFGGALEIVAALYRGGGGITFHPCPFLQQASGQVFKDDVNGFFYLEYLLYGQYSLET